MYNKLAGFLIIILCTALISFSFNLDLSRLELNFNPQDSAYYYIIDNKTKLALDGDGSKEDPLYLKAKSDSEYQHWKFIFVKFKGYDSLYQIVNRETAMAVDVYKEDYRNNQKLISWPKKESLKAEINQLFWFEGENSIRILSQKGGDTMNSEVYFLSVDNKNQLILKSNSQTDKEQIWLIEKVK